MFFSRKKTEAKIKAIAAENTASFAKSVEDARQKIEKIEKISDAGERYLALVDFEAKMDRLMDDATRQVNEQWTILLKQPRKKAADIVAMSGGGIGGALVLGGMITLAASGVGLALLAAGGGVALTMGSFTAADKIEASAHNLFPLLAEGRDAFYRDISVVLKEAASQKNTLIKHQLPALAASPHFDKLYDKFPVVKNAFLKASAKQSALSHAVKLDKPSYPRPKQ